MRGAWHAAVGRLLLLALAVLALGCSSSAGRLPAGHGADPAAVAPAGSEQGVADLLVPAGSYEAPGAAPPAADPHAGHHGHGAATPSGAAADPHAGHGAHAPAAPSGATADPHAGHGAHAPAAPRVPGDAARPSDPHAGHRAGPAPASSSADPHAGHGAHPAPPGSAR